MSIRTDNKDIQRHLEVYAPISEITADPASIVKLDAQLVSEMTEGDPDPQFPIIAIEEGKSKNNIIYDASILQSIAEQVNNEQPCGYLGHKHREGTDKENLLPPPQTVWLGATTAVENGKTKLYVKGYNLPDADVRDWIKRKAVNSVSWAGDAVLTPVKEGGYRVKELFLESIDWSRKNKQGMNAKVLVTVSEMEGESSVTAEEIAKLQLVELEENNSQLVKVISDRAFADGKTVGIQETEKKVADAKATETAPVEVSEVQKLREFFKIEDGKSVVDSVVEMYQKFEGIAKKEITDWFNTEVLDKKVPNEKARRLVGRLISVSEMEGNFIDDAEEIKKKISKRVDDALEKDEDVKTIIAEMGSDRGGVRLSNSSTTSSTAHSNSDDKNKLVENENFSVETISI